MFLLHSSGYGEFSTPPWVGRLVGAKVSGGISQAKCSVGIDA